MQAVHLESDAFLVCLNHALSTEKEEVMGLCIGEVSQPTSPARTLPSGLPTSPGGCWPRPGLWRPQAPSAHPWIGYPPCLCSLKASGAFQKPPAVPIKPLGEAGAGEGRVAFSPGCAQCWPTLCDPVYCSPPGSSVRGILHWSGLPFPPGDRPHPGLEPGSPASPTLVGGLYCVAFL